MAFEHSLPSVATIEDVTPEQFSQTVIPNRQPVILKGLVRHWPAVQKANASQSELIDYLKSLDNNRPIPVMEAQSSEKGLFFYTQDMQGFNFTRRDATVSETIDRLIATQGVPEPATIYLQTTPTPLILPEFGLQNPLSLLPPVVEPRIWLGNATRTQTHHDQNHNIACVVAGKRRFTLFPPEQVSNLYLGPMDKTPAGSSVSMVRLDEPDYEQFPRFKEALKHALVADLEPGDALYVPIYWWHHVEAPGSFNILINYWWGGFMPNLQNPMAAFLEGLLALKDLHPKDRSFWAAMFNHYVFERNGDPVAHLPEEMHGRLGKPSQQRYELLISKLKNYVSRTRF